ncbi:L-threonylcarbamoyladenylate synthase [Legionella taurinensis]|uniref:Threonylcarbamoyl-AMP synthase n=1 Tax=Legionella taurinensis TaxID=70611 RepID=A0A3A5L720_9GAMM|nr:L-threonylcarbamoyladenylate synthase [Legionella taurinensis]RJT49102.1 threonylcarbamoyl-AMP synthase [Legionella taurinensis]RJT67362.1 threonylcarbamoyl-AMP synthase [Legionella taurinensis]STY27012.1 translation initiation protein [Legionella taurinensis]
MSTITHDIESAVTRLRQGDIVAVPTETVYGLAGSAENEQAIRRLFALKNRPLNHPLIMHVAEHWDLSTWVTSLPDYAKKLIDHFWPGPLTLVLPSHPDNVHPLVNGGQTTLAIRCPRHPVIQEVLTRLGEPLVAPSANPFGKISPTTAQHVQQSFPHAPLLILDGGRCEVGIESTIVAATDPQGYQILRHGMVDEAMLAALLPGQELKEHSTLRAPGRLEHHYQPQKPLYCFEDSNALETFLKELSGQVYVLSFQKNTRFAEQTGYQLPADPAILAYELYFQLRQADEAQEPLLAMELPPDTPAWQGVRERALKAGRKHAL